MENVNSVVTLNQWEAAALETALEQAIEKGFVDKGHGEKTLQRFRRFSKPGGTIRFEE